MNTRRPDAFDLRNFTIHEMTLCGTAIRKIGEGAVCMEEAADRIVRYLYDSLIDAQTGGRVCSLVRFFKTHSYSGLDGTLQNFAGKMLGETQAFPDMKCLVLLATAGEKPEWKSRVTSRGHKAVPLPSEEVVQHIPMISNLVKQLGVDVNTVIRPDPELILDTEQTTYNIFYVPDAVSSPYIPAQSEFVVPRGIKSVLGFGGLLPSGNIFAVIMFTKVPVSREAAGLFRTLSLNAKLAVLPFEATVFTEACRKTATTGEISKTELRSLRAQRNALEQLLEVYEQTALEQTKKLFDEITRRMRMEEELRRLEYKYHYLFENLTDAAFLADSETGIILDTNLRAEQLLGRARDEIIGMNQSELHLPGQAEEYRRRFELHAKEGHQADYDGEVIRKDGVIVPVSIAATPSVLGGKNVLLGLFRDISERKRAEEEARRREAVVGRLNTALVALAKNDTIYSGDIEAAFMAITETSAHAMDVSRVSIWFYTEGDEGITCRDLYEMNSGAHSEGLVFEAAAYPAFFSAMREEYSIAADNAVEDPRTKEFSEAYLGPLGITSMLDVLIRVAGKVVGVVCHEHVGAMRKWTIEEQSFVTAIAGFTSVAIESHERIKGDEEIRKLNAELELKVEERTKQLLATQEELVRKEKLSILGQLAGSVGHELRNPLGVMNNAIYFLKTVLSDSDETVREYLGIIKSEVDNSERIISDLLDFARTKTPQVRTVSCRGLLDESLGKCAVPDNVELQTDLPDTLPLLRVDPLQMGQVFQNLIINAVQAMPEGGELRISARLLPDVGATRWVAQEERKEGRVTASPLQKTADFIEISVTDTGEGISPENMKKLFQPLFTTKPKGIGLGLVVCRNLVEANGGKIAMVSGPGKGTTSVVILPCESGREMKKNFIGEAR